MTNSLAQGLTLGSAVPGLRAARGRGRAGAGRVGHVAAVAAGTVARHGVADAHMMRAGRGEDVPKQLFLVDGH